MTLKKNLGFVLLGIWLIGSGLTPFINISFLKIHLILAVLAVVTGVVILIQNWK